MNIKTTTRVSTKAGALCLFTDKKGLPTLKKEFPEIIPFLQAKELAFDGESIVTFDQIVHKKKQTVYILGLPTKATLQDIFDGFGAIAKKVSAQKVDTAIFHAKALKDLLEKEDFFVTAIKGISSGLYEFNKFFTEKKTAEPKMIYFITGSKKADSYLDWAMHIADSIRLTRDLVNEPANLLKPTQLAEIAKETFASGPVKVTVYSKSQIEKLGMNLYLSVAKGSEAEPKLIVMRYDGDPTSKERVGLIGKGLTFDSGGYSLKPTPSMLNMKVDMGGSGAVIGAMRIIAEEQPKINVVAVVAACENMISGRAYLPGDIITSMNGKTVEIGNTDAEGRLTLADAITYAIRKEHATSIIDICTLTGACMMALGEEYAGIVTWEDKLWKKVEEASAETLDHCWRLPLNKYIKKMNKGKGADLKNIGGQFCGAQTAGSFLGEFVEGKPWIHIDIAGTVSIETEKPAQRTGATGFGAHLLAQLAKKM